MEEQALRLAAYAHIRAIAAHDLESAIAFVVIDEREQARANLAAAVNTVIDAEMDDVDVHGDDAVVRFRVRTSDPESPGVWLETIWRDSREGPQLQVGYRI